MKTLIICSGGLDSVVLAYKTARERKLAGLLSFDYGQRHKKELRFAARCAERLDVQHSVIDIASFGRQLEGSALTDEIAVPEGHYAEETMKTTIVPNRNAIMLTMAYGLAAARGFEAVGAAVHGGDHFIYPDCRPDFIKAFETMQNHALAGVDEIELYTPFLNLTKAGIVSEGERLGVDFSQTWSCYKGGARHCGRCGTCVERREAFHLAGVEDPTIYDDSDFWRAAVQDNKRSA